MLRRAAPLVTAAGPVRVGAPGRPLVVWQAGVPWDGLAGTDRHLVEHLVEHVDVLWVDPPRSVVRSLRSRTWQALRARSLPVGDHLVRLALPAPPCPDRPGMDAVTRRWTAWSIRRALRRLGRRPAAVVVTSPHPPLDVAPGALRVYYATDDFTAGARLMGKGQDRFRRIEQRRLAEADVAGAVSPEILERWPVRVRVPFVLPNGCDPVHFAGVDLAPPPTDVDLPAPVAGLVGQLSARVDLSLLEALADAGVALLLVGPRHAAFEPSRVDALLARPCVTWVGEKTFAELPSYLRVIDVGLTPYVQDEFNRASFPLKTLEYLSAGRSVVSSALPAVGRLGTDRVRAADGPVEFVAAVREVLAAGRDAETVTECRAFAARHSWAVRAADFVRLTGLDGAAARDPVVATARPGGR